MKRTILTILVVSATLPAATVIGDVGSGPLNGYSVGNRSVSQVFQAPAADNVLTEWQFQVAGFVPNRGFTTNISLLIYDWNGTITLSVPHLSVSIPWPAATGLVSLSGLNIPLVSGQTYVAVYDTGDYRDQTIGFYSNNPYPDGRAAFANDIAGLNASAATNLDTVFSATFVHASAGQAPSVPEPATSSLLLAGAGVAIIRRIQRGRHGYGTRSN